MRNALALLVLVTCCAASADLADDLRRWEGFSATCYADNGGWSVGYGHWSPTRQPGVTRAEAERLLAADITVARVAACKVVPGLAAMPAEACDVVVALSYQLGESRLRRFKAMRAALVAGDYSLAADELLDSRLAKQCPARAQELAARLRAIVQ